MPLLNDKQKAEIVLAIAQNVSLEDIAKLVHTNISTIENYLEKNNIRSMVTHTNDRATQLGMIQKDNDNKTKAVVMTAGASEVFDESSKKNRKQSQRMKDMYQKIK